VAEPWQPTAEQRSAIEVEGSAVVRAGAGCGKTAVLARRFVHLLRPGGPVGDVGQVLAITFTEKAAAEMKRKIREVVAAELAGADERTRPHWTRVQRELLGAQISTIHAFCARVLRENPLEAGVDPEAVVLDEHETRTYVESVVEAALLVRLRGGDPGARELLLRRNLAGGRTGGAVGVVTDLLARLVRSGRDGRWLVAATAAQEAHAPRHAAALREAAARLVRTVDERLAAGGRGTGMRALAAEWTTWRTRLERLAPETPLDDFVALADLRQLLADARLAGAVKNDLADQDGRLRGALADAYGFVRALPENARIAATVAGVADVLRERKRDDAVLTFDDLVVETRAVLDAHPAVRDRYGRRFRAVLVDEFQDTDRMQADVIALLGAGVPPPFVFVVGDEKQSIYRFRGADVTVFNRVRAEVGRDLPLGTNFRSLPPILALVNALAARIFAPPAGADPAHWVRFDPEHRLVPDRTDVQAAPAVRLVTFVAEHAARSLKVAEARELEARVLAGVVERLHAEEGVRHGDVAVLFRAFTEVKTYENALRRREIPYYVVKGRGFFQCQEVSDMASILAAVLDRDDGVALAAALRSPLFALDDDTLRRLAWPAGRDRPALARRFHAGDDFADVPTDAARLVAIRDLLIRLRALASRATIAELLEEVCAATDFEAVCLTQFQGTQKVANVRKLIELARDWERKRFFSLRDFVRTVRRMAETEPREPEAPLVGEQDDVVRLMTIHQAKGLEFPVVIVPDLGRASNPDNRIPALDEELGIVGGPIDATGRVVVGHAGLDVHRARERDRERAEQARLFYVACTRAKDVLVLLEGKGDARYLATGEGDRTSWCHQVWDVVGRERIAEFVPAGADDRTLALPDGSAVRLERAGRHLAAAAGEPPAREVRVAPAGPGERAQVARVLDFVPPPPAAVVTSPTALADFRRCPRQYWYRQVLGLPERGSGGTRAALLGTAAHAVLEAVALDGAADDEIVRRLGTFGLPPADVAPLATDVRTAVAALRDDVAAGLEIVGREVPVVLALPRGTPRVFLHGRIDLLARRAGALVVRDYKYVRAATASVETYASQLGAYRLAAGPGAAGEIVFLRGGTVVTPLPPIDDAAEATELVRAADALGGALADGTVAAFPRTPAAPSVCAALGCGYVRRCWPRSFTVDAATRRASGRRSCSAAS